MATNNIEWRVIDDAVLLIEEIENLPDMPPLKYVFKILDKKTFIECYKNGSKGRLRKMAKVLTPHEAYKRAEYAIITLTTCPGYYFGDGPRFSDMECKYYKRAYKLGHCRTCWHRYMSRNGIKEL